MLSRAGPPTCAISKVCRSAQRRSYAAPKPPPKAKAAVPGPKKSKAFKKAGDGSENGKKNPRTLANNPMFTPLPESQLGGSELFVPKSKLDLPLFRPNALTPTSVGAAYALPEDGEQPYKIYGLPRRVLVDLRLTSTPWTVVRQVTLDTIAKLEIAGQEITGKHKTQMQKYIEASRMPESETEEQMEDDEKMEPEPEDEDPTLYEYDLHNPEFQLETDASSLFSRFVFTGRAGTGKSVALFQAVQWASASKWIVIYIPRAVNLVNSTTTYAYDLRTQLYHQPDYSLQTLQRILVANKEQLSTLLTSKDHFFFDAEEGIVGKGKPLAKLLDVAIKEPSLSASVLDGMMTELQMQMEYPVLLAVDDFQALYCRTHYKSPHHEQIRSYHLSLPRLLLEFACGRRFFPRGAVLGALTTTDPHFMVPPVLHDALDLPLDSLSLMNPYTKRDKHLVAYTEDLEPIVMPEQFTLKEAASVFDVWKQDNALLHTDYDQMFMAKYTETSANPRNFVRQGLMGSLET